MGDVVNSCFIIINIRLQNLLVQPSTDLIVNAGTISSHRYNPALRRLPHLLRRKSCNGRAVTPARIFTRYAIYINARHRRVDAA